MNHLFYQASLKYYTAILNDFDAWTLSGLGFATGSFFHLKYVIFYGIPGVFAKEDGISNAPDHPKCIARIHLYSDMWRYFDVGLYDFLKHHMYVPLTKTLPKGMVCKFLSSGIVFTFIYLWHGVVNSVMYWSLYNFFSVTMEAIGKGIGSHPTYQSLENSILTPQGKRRFHAILGAPLFTCSVIANYFFLLGITPATLIFKRTFSSDSWSTVTPVVMFFSYCAAQFSIEAKNWDILTSEVEKLGCERAKKDDVKVKNS